MAIVGKFCGCLQDEEITNQRSWLIILSTVFVDLQLVPRLIRADRGSKNVVVAEIERYFKEFGEDDMAGINCFKSGPSARNQQMEAR